MASNDELVTEMVKVCPYCGHFNLGTEKLRCDRCWLLLRKVVAVPRSHAESREIGKKRRILINRLIRPILAIAISIGFTTWGLLVFIDREPTPENAVTDINVTVNSKTWALGRGDPQNTAFTRAQARTPKEINWTYSNPMSLLASPSVVDGRVYLTTQDGLAVALDAETGKTLWEHSTGLPSSSTPAVTNGIVVIGLRPGEIVALDNETGSVLWHWRKRDGENHIFTSPIIVNGTVYVGSGRTLRAFDVYTGQQLWDFKTKEWILSPVAYKDDTIVIATRDSLIHIVDAKTGKMRFVFDSGRTRFGEGPLVHENIAYFTSYGGLVWAIDRLAITYPIERAVWYWKFQFFMWNMISAPPQQKGSIWGTRVGGDILSNPAFAHSKVYVANVQGKVFALDAGTGKVLWETDVGFHTSTAPTVAGTTVLIGTVDGLVFGLDTDTGEILWNFKVHGTVTDSPIVVDDTMYVIAADGKLYAVGGTQ